MLSVLIFTVFIVLKCQNVGSKALWNCDARTELYIQDGELVQVRRDRYDPHYVELEACASNRTDLTGFDADRIFTNVSITWLVGIPWPFSHPTPDVQRISMNDLISFGPWGNCSNLKHIYAKQGSKFANSNKFTMVPSDWLINCTQLRSLDLRNLSVAEIRTVLDSALYLEELKLYHIKYIAVILHYPLIIKDRINYNLKQLHFVEFSLNADLTGLNTTWAEISSNLVCQLSLLPSLEILQIMDEKFDMCSAPSVLPKVNFEKMSFLRLQRTNTAQLCLRKYRMPNLSKLEFWASPTFNMIFSDLFSAPAQQIVLNFFDSAQIENFEFTRDDYLTLSDMQNGESRKGNITLLGIKKSLECDCDRRWWFARALRAKLMTAPGVICTDDRAPADLECESLDCDRISCESVCVCCREVGDQISADCREVNLMTLPTELLLLPNISQILVPDNNISTIPDRLPDTLLRLDLSGNNNILQGDPKEVDVLFSHPKRRVLLARNYILCSCENEILIRKLYKHRHQIEDFKNITCAVTNIKLEDIDVSKLCETRDRDAALLKHREATLMGVGVMIVITVSSLVLGIILYNRRRQIQIYLFARGWCLCCVTEEEIDADRRFDIFISFCHEDSKLVLEELLPPLDRDYTVCLHLRDWFPGEMITTQITWSVEQSRRTIVVMSRSFVRSLWGQLEFQTAHVHGLADGRTRVLMVVVDDVLEKEKLEPEMRAYVRLNTYVKWGDPWFWEKLRYALPHRPLSAATTAHQQNEESHDNYIEIEEIE